jgi:Reverse transcriptase (RNA-dependent DNA polymerase)
LKLKNGDVRGAYQGMQKWYRSNPEITTNPTRDDIDKIQKEFQTLYSKNENKENILRTYVKYNINDKIPEEEEIIKSLKKLRNGKAPGSSGISVDEIKSWYNRARVLKEEKIDEKAIKLWDSVIEIIKIAFRTGEVPMAFKRGTLVLIPKPGSNDFRGIALLETIYKIVSMIIHRRLIESIPFHDSIHGFRTERGTSTAIINIKLKMQLAKRKKIPLYMIFLDIKKAYDTLDRGRIMILLKEYGLGNNICKLMENIWDNDTVIPKQNLFYGNPFFAERGVRQGDIVSPTIFNIVIDAIVRDCFAKLEEAGDDTTLVQFYADDGLICGEDYDMVQKLMSLITQNFLTFGLKMNVLKTEAMIMKADKKRMMMSEESYARRILGVGLSSIEQQKTRVSCEFCNKIVQKGSLKNHYLSYNCKKAQKSKNATIIQENMTCIEIETTPNIYEIDVQKNIMTKCPCLKCPFDTDKCMNMRKHFRARHIDDIIIIRQEGLLPQCQECGLFQKNVNSSQHLNSEECKKYAEIRRNTYLDKCYAAAENVCFNINDEEIKKVNQFKYLGRILSDNDDDMIAIEKQLMKAKMVWGRIGKIIKKKTNANPKIMSIFYKVIIQSVLLYGSESWVLTDRMQTRLNSFHHRCARYITGRHITMKDNVWTYPDTKSTLELADLLTLEEYIEKRKSTIFGFAENLQIYKNCEMSNNNKGRNNLVWWPENCIRCSQDLEQVRADLE